MGHAIVWYLYIIISSIMMFPSQLTWLSYVKQYNDRLEKCLVCDVRGLRPPPLILVVCHRIHLLMFPSSNYWSWRRHQMETFPRYWPFVRGIHRWPVNSPHKGQWRGALMFSLICARINAWVNNGEAGDLSRHRAHYDVTVMIQGIQAALDVRDATKVTTVLFITVTS